VGLSKKMPAHGGLGLRLEDDLIGYDSTGLRMGHTVSRRHRVELRAID
jgi:hypothetical protein